jgi:stage V sporulation protein AC
MKTSKEQYSKMVKEISPTSPHLKHWALSFLVGGLICAVGEGVKQLSLKLGATEDQVKVIVPCALVLLAAVLTALGVFDKISKQAGAGTGVPITGFANAIVSPAMEHHTEGLVLGTGANMFRLAGPVLAYGTAVCTLYGLIYYFFLRG